MVNPAELVDAFVDKLRGIDSLVALLGSDASNIRPYYDRFPKSSSLALALHKMPQGSVLVAWDGMGPGMEGSIQVWKQRLCAYIKSPQIADDDPSSAGYYSIFREMVKGKPDGGDISLEYLTVHGSFNPMDTPSVERRTTSEGLDFFEVSISFTETSDD